MIRKLTILGVVFGVSLIILFSRIRINEESLTVPVFPTATNHFFFLSDTISGTPIPNSPAPITGVPTVAGIFLNPPSATPIVVKHPSPLPIQAQIPTIPTQYFTETIYEDSVNLNWEVHTETSIKFDLDDPTQVFRGKSSISFTSEEDNGSLFFTVSEKSKDTYPRDQVSLLTFWLYTGEEPLRLDQLAVSIVGSNSQTYWSADDHSVTVPDDLPVFSETRLYYLGLNYEIPARTWVPVELDLDKTLIYDPDYKYVTGFYLKTEVGFSRTLWVDDINMIMYESAPGTLAEGENEVEPTPAPVSQKKVTVKIDAEEAVHPISELIYGISGASPEYLKALRPTLHSWGGDASSRYNWKLGNAWNLGRDFFYQNTNNGFTGGSASNEFISQAMEAGIEVRLTLPTLGWVAKDNDENTCSFPLADGSCGDADGASCQEPGLTADPILANVPSYQSTIVSWVAHLVREQSFKIRFLAMDNEPELWGFTHYDVHPKCTTYDEILKHYLTYTAAVHPIVPDAELVGPVTSGWNYYWNSAAGEQDKARYADQDFLPWFLDKVNGNDRKTGWRSLHVLDIHYYPEGLYNDDVDEETAAHRLRSTRSLWDRDYVEESSIEEPVYLIPRMKELIEEHYPDTKLGLSGWNWGADETMNGALAIADVLGIFGREDLYYAAYWQYPPLESPGFYAFKMYTNYDGNSGRFGDTSVFAQSDDVDILGSYAAVDSVTGDLHLMLLNKQVDGNILAQVELENFAPLKSTFMYRYDGEHPKEITTSKIEVAAGDFSVSLPPYSITLLVVEKAE